MYEQLKDVLAKKASQKDNKFDLILPVSGTLSLEETKGPNRHSAMSIKVSGVPNDGVIQLKCPENQPDFFQDDYRKVCDYIILVPAPGGQRKVKAVFANSSVSEMRGT